tara:strand:- start:92 stop:532 length:441 start_codon:yes stop_codon:yes gene_type:complete
MKETKEKKRTKTMKEIWLQDMEKDKLKKRKKQICKRIIQLHNEILSATKEEWNEERWNNAFKEFRLSVKAYYKDYFSNLEKYDLDKIEHNLKNTHNAVLTHLALESSFHYTCLQMILVNSDEFKEALWLQLEQHCYMTDSDIGFFQ